MQPASARTAGSYCWGAPPSDHANGQRPKGCESASRPLVDFGELNDIRIRRTNDLVKYMSKN
jgi:hypothetical protein